MQGSIVNIKADAIVHPTNDSFYMGGDVGKEIEWDMRPIGLFIVGKALANAGGQELRDAVADVAKNGGLANAAEGKILSLSRRVVSRSMLPTSGDQPCAQSLRDALDSCSFAEMECG